MTIANPSATTLNRRTLLGAAALAPALLEGGVATAAPVCAATAPLSTPADLVVETHAGRVRGFEQNGMRAFFGIPYAASTAGANRFAPPQPVTPWTGTRLALVPGAIAPQTVSADEGGMMAFLMQPIMRRQDEDCLSLNVWTPAADNRHRPVMVWIHGGNFSTGSSYSDAINNGAPLAARGDVVVLSINHRLNLFGYLDLVGAGAPAEYASASNAGMLDLVAGLQWVRDNIGRFGGDPANITLFGQSGGGLKITTLCAMPAAAGLFHKAIVQSGSFTRVFGPELTVPLASALLAALEIAPADAGKLREVPVEALLAAGGKIAAARRASAGNNLWKRVGWGPRVGDAVIPHQPYDPASRTLSAPVPLMVGSTRHEFVGTMFSLAAEDMTLAQAEASMASTYRDPAGLLRAFAARYPQEKPVGLAAMIGTVDSNRRNALEQARAKLALGGAPVWNYRFDWQTPMLDGMPRAYHCSDLPMVFHTSDIVPQSTGGGAAALRMADRMCDAWITFARNGNPNHPGIPHWQPLGAATTPTLIFDDTCIASPDADSDLRALVVANRL